MFVVHIPVTSVSESLCFLSPQRPRTSSRWWSWRRRWTADLPRWSERLNESRAHMCTLTHSYARTHAQRCRHSPCRTSSTVQRIILPKQSVNLIFKHVEAARPRITTSTPLSCQSTLFHWAIAAYRCSKGGVTTFIGTGDFTLQMRQQEHPVLLSCS